MLQREKLSVVIEDILRCVFEFLRIHYFLCCVFLLGLISLLSRWWCLCVFLLTESECFVLQFRIFCVAVGVLRQNSASVGLQVGYCLSSFSVVFFFFFFFFSRSSSSSFSSSFSSFSSSSFSFLFFFFLLLNLWFLLSVFVCVSWCDRNQVSLS